MSVRKINTSGFAHIVALLVVMVIAVGAAAYFFLSKENSGMLDKVENPVKKIAHIPTSTPTPTPAPFYEMTIPGLRDRVYESELDGLTQTGSNSSYTTYRTSYDSDGNKINGLLMVPTGDIPEGGWPAVVFVHGYIPPTVYKTDSNYVSYAAALAADGLVVFKIDLRGHDESEGEAFGTYYDEGYVVDTLNAHSALENYNIVNPNKIGLWGHSMGGNVVFRGFVASEKVRKIVIWAGAVYTYEDFAKFRIDDNSYRPPTDDSKRREKRERLRETHGDFDPDDDFWKLMPGTNFLDGKLGEIQIHHAVNDTVVDIGYSRDLIEVLDSTPGVEGELFEYSTGGHNLTGSSFTTAMDRSAEFLRSY